MLRRDVVKASLMTALGAIGFKAASVDEVKAEETVTEAFELARVTSIVTGAGRRAGVPILLTERGPIAWETTPDVTVYAKIKRQ